MTSFIARFRGACPSCGDVVEVGDVIVPFELGGYAHVGCTDLPIRVRAERVCPTCWLVQPCDCEAR